MKNKTIISILILIIAIFITPRSIISVNAVSTTHANQANSSAGNSLGSRLKVESVMTNTGHSMKVTLYLCKTNNIPRDSNGNVLSPYNVGINQFVKFGKSILVGTEADVGYTGAFVNIDTCKLDQITKQVAPVYKTTSINSIGGLVTELNIPAWGDGECNAANTTAIKNYFTCANDAKLINLDNLIRIIAKKATGKSGTEAVNEALTKAKTSDFVYINPTGEKIDLGYKNILPFYGEQNYVANWLVVMEPMFTYKQDPYSYFGSKGGKTAVMTATECVLENRAAGLKNSAFSFKFNSGSPSYNSTVRYCSECNVTWFAFAKTPQMAQVATYCPLPCPAVGGYAERKEVRYPFAINSAIRNMAKAWQLSETWLNGYAKASALSSKPTEDEILKYGGYSLYFLGPKMQQPKTTQTPTPPPTPTPAPVTAGNVIAENELVKAMQSDAAPGGNVSRVSVTKTSVDTTCPGYTSVWHDGWTDAKKVYHEGYYSYPNCGHDYTLANAKGVTLNTISVQTAWYWDASMFTDVSRLSALRKNGALTNDGVVFVFNTTNQFVSSNMNDVFGSTLTEYKFMTHRNADPDNNGAVKPLQIAAYMNGTTLNSNYLTFINPYYGATYPSAYNNPTGNFGRNDFELITSINLPQNATAIGSGNFCSGGSSSSLKIPVKLSGEITYGKTTVKDSTFKTFTPITIDPTVQSANKAADQFETNSLYWGVDPNDDVNPSYHIQVESDAVTFNPAFKMKYQSSNDVNSLFKEVWVLSAGKKKFISNDYVKIELTNTNLKVSCPWSRDSEDKVDENGSPRTIPTAKSGSAIYAKTTDDGDVLKIDVYFHILDPNFVSPGNRASVQSHNDEICKTYDDMCLSVANQLKTGTSFYSNMFQSCTSDTIHKLESPTNFIDLSRTSELKLISPVTINYGSIITQMGYIDVNGIADYDPTGKRTVSLRGQSYPVKKWEDTSAVQSEKVLESLLVEGGGQKINGWYNEDFEGLIVCHRTYFILCSAKSTIAQIHPQHSDSRTPRNELAEALPFYQLVNGKTVNLIEAGQYGIGIEHRFSFNIGSEQYKVCLTGVVYPYDIRGAIYDTK